MISSFDDARGRPLPSGPLATVVAAFEEVRDLCNAVRAAQVTLQAEILDSYAVENYPRATLLLQRQRLLVKRAGLLEKRLQLLSRTLVLAHEHLTLLPPD